MRNLITLILICLVSVSYSQLGLKGGCESAFVKSECYSQELTQTVTFSIEDYEKLIQGDTLSLPGVEQIWLDIDQGPNVTAGNAIGTSIPAILDGNHNGNNAATFNFYFSDNIDIQFAFNSVFPAEAVQVNTIATPSGNFANSAANRYHNNNSNNPFFLDYHNVSTVSFLMLGNANTASIWITEYTGRQEYAVNCYADSTIVVFRGKEELEIDTIADDWIKCQDACICEKLDYTVEAEVQSNINEIRTVTLLDHTYLRSSIPSGVTLNPATAVGSTASTTDVEFYTPEGLIIPAKVTVERIQAGTSFMSIGSTGGGGMGGGASDFIVTVEILPDDFGNVYDSALMAVRPAGVNGGGANESLVFDQGSAIIDYSRGPNGTNITTFPYTGVFNNNNNNSSSALGFEAGHVISFRKVNTNPWTASVPIVLKNPPELRDIECCDLIDSLFVINTVLVERLCEVEKKNAELQADLDDIDLDIERCTGIFENCSNRSGNRFVRATSTVNLGWEYTDWARVGNAVVTSPDCVTDLQIVARLGDRYFQNDNSAIYTYYDTRLLINGAAVTTRVADTYDYEVSFHNRLDIDLDDIATVTFHRDNVPAGATIELEFRMRSLYTSMTQPTPSARIVWSGIRSEASFSFNPNDEITDVSVLAKDSYWLKEEFTDLPFASTYLYGFGEPPEDAKTYGSERALQNQVSRSEKSLDEILDRDIKEIENTK